MIFFTSTGGNHKSITFPVQLNATHMPVQVALLEKLRRAVTCCCIILVVTEAEGDAQNADD